MDLYEENFANVSLIRSRIFPIDLSIERVVISMPRIAGNIWILPAIRC